MSFCLNYDVTGFTSTKAEILIKFTSMIYASDKKLKHIFWLTLAGASKKKLPASCILLVFSFCYHSHSFFKLFMSLLSAKLDLFLHAESKQNICVGAFRETRPSFPEKTV